MDSHRIGIKLFVSTSPSHLEGVVPVFHSWIQQQALAGNLLIDVADYLHVPSGPGVVLIAHEANYATDQADPGLGLLYLRKRAMTEETFVGRLKQAFREALSAARLLEQEPKLAGQWKFDSKRIDVRIADKLLAPNTPETFAALKPELTAFFTKLLGSADFVIEHDADPKICFEVRVLGKSPKSVEELLSGVQGLI